MIFGSPVPFKEALQAAGVRSILKTTGGSADLQRLEPAIKRRAMFSATVDVAKRLQGFSDGINELLNGDNDQASVRAGLKLMLEADGYVPDPEKAGTLQDLGSTDRLNLILETNIQTAQGYGQYVQGMQTDVLDEFPAQELFRAFGPSDASKERDWAARWTKVGGQFFGPRMIALKTDEIWSRLGTEFPDGLGNPYPPFAFNSGMDVRDIDRDEAESLGLIDPGQQLTPEVDDFNADLEASPDVRASWLRDALDSSGAGRFDGDVFKFNGGTP